MTRTFSTPDGQLWTVHVVPPSPHRKKPDPRVLLSFVAGGKQRLQHAEPGFVLEAASEADLVAILERDEWGLLKPSHPDMDDGAGKGRSTVIHGRSTVSRRYRWDS